jgi:hypothetical protein
MLVIRKVRALASRSRVRSEGFGTTRRPEVVGGDAPRHPVRLVAPGVVGDHELALVHQEVVARIGVSWYAKHDVGTAAQGVAAAFAVALGLGVRRSRSAEVRAFMLGGPCLMSASQTDGKPEP